MMTGRTPQTHERLRGRKWMAIRKQVIASNPICQICGDALAEEVDHITPLAKGGSNERDNLQSACKSCNAAKGTGDKVHITGLDGWPVVEWRASRTGGG